MQKSKTTTINLIRFKDIRSTETKEGEIKMLDVF